MNHHDAAVSAISDQVKIFHERREPFRLYHGSTNSTRPSQRNRGRMIDITNLNNVLQVDTQAKFALVEPNVPMDELVEATLRHSLIPPVVMEFPGITVGGGFAGTAAESSSFRHGFFDRTITWIEIVLANGDIETAAPSDNPELLYGAASSFGTIGITTLLKVDLREAKSYVELTYRPISSMNEAMQRIEEVTNDPSTDYMDGILFAVDHGVVCSGRLVDEPAGRVQRFNGSRDPWFYLHAKRLIGRSNEPIVESIPLAEYLFRYDRGAFWVGAYAFNYFVTPFNRITRWLLDYFMHTRVMYHALHQSGHSRKYIIQDVAVPYPAATEFLEYVDESFGHYPLWLCPVHQRGQSPESPYGPLAEKYNPSFPDMLLNFGVWGPDMPPCAAPSGPNDRHAFIDANRRLEQKINSLNGRQWLYAHTYHTEAEFWALYDREEYDALRTKYDAAYLPSIYDKVKVEIDAEEKAIKESWIIWLLALFWSIWPLSGLYGVYKAAFGGDYLLPCEAEPGHVQKVKVQDVFTSFPSEKHR